jgi:hypothetical protein
MAKHNIEKLNELYESAESCDEELFSEMRSNLLLVSGNHYSKKTTAFFSQIRNSQRLNETQKLRLTKNHIQRITKHYRNSIVSKVPGVHVAPQNPLDMNDKKASELNQAVWADAKARYAIKELTGKLAHDFVEIGEMCVFMYWNPNAGEVKGYAPQVDELGQPVMDQMGQMVAEKESPIFTGAFEFDIIPGFNLLRPSQAKDIKKAPHLIVREMVDTQELLATFGEESKAIVGDGDTEAFVVFDTNKKQYNEESTQALVRYHFFRPNKVYPEGYYYISTERGILEEGVLPFGVFPIIWEGFDTFSSNPRGHSIIKVARPFQAEINRASSQAATHQITVGDDKLIYQGGTKLAPGALLPGVRGITYQGMAPQILPGRTGEQFLPYIASQIAEMYQACMVEEINQEEPANADPYTLLFRSASQKAKFTQYTEKFENFLKNFCMTFLNLARNYYPEDMIIQAVGKSEQINLQEFKNANPLSYQISIEEQSDDISSRMGRQLALNHLIQYAGTSLGPKQLALIAKDMPFINNDSLVKRLSLDYDNVDNDMLQLERGQMPFVSPYADNNVYIEMLTHRMKQADFHFLQPQIQQLYSQYLSIHEEETGRKEKALQSAKDGFIPTGGSLITVQMTMPDSTSQSGTRQVRLPYEAVYWLIKKLEDQGSGLEQLEQMNQGAIVDIQQMGQGQAALQQPPPQQA